MPVIPAFCDSCGTAFPSGFFVENCLSLSLSGNKSGPCPNCGAMGHVPDGVFNIIGNTIEILTAPERTVFELRRLAEILQTARVRGTVPEEVVRDIEKEFPSLSPLMQLMPTNRSEWYAFLAVILSAIQIYLAAFPSSSNQTPNPPPNITVNQVIEQTIIMEPVPKRKSHKAINGKISRNAPCSCKSGKKYKRCCGAIR
jgi:hypothetical protein